MTVAGVAPVAVAVVVLFRYLEESYAVSAAPGTSMACVVGVVHRVLGEQLVAASPNPDRSLHARLSSR